MGEVEKVEKKETAPKNVEKIEEQPSKQEKVMHKAEGVKEKEEEKEKPKRSSTEVILHKKPAKLITLLLQDKPWQTASLARESGQSYVYATNLIKTFESTGLISISLSGRRRMIKLTEKGERLAHLIDEIEKASL